MGENTEARHSSVKENAFISHSRSAQGPGTELVWPGLCKECGLPLQMLGAPEHIEADGNSDLYFTLGSIG